MNVIYNVYNVCIYIYIYNIFDVTNMPTPIVYAAPCLRGQCRLLRYYTCWKRGI